MRRLSAAVAAVIVFALVAPVTAVSAASFVTVTNVTVEPSSPMPGELTTVESTIRNPQGNSGSVSITDVAVRQRGTADELVRVENPARLSPGSSTVIPLQLSLDDPGRHVLTVHVYGHGGGSSGRIHIQHPITVTVGGQHPGIDLETDEPILGTANAGEVKVANGLDGAIRNVKLSVEGDGPISVTNGRSVVAKLESGESTSTNFTFRASEPGEHTIVTNLSYVTSAGTERTVTEETTVVVDELEVDARTVGTGSDRAVEVDVTNRGDADIEDVSVTGSSQNASVSQAQIDEIPAGESRTARLNLSIARSTADVTVEAAYEMGQRNRQASTTLTVNSAPGSIDLTGVQVTPEGESIQITGSASNVGLSDVKGVVVRVVGTDAVSPAYPNKEYFVGTVPSSDFVSFDVYATTTANATTIPVEVSYLVDGERQNRVFRYEAPTTSSVPDAAEQQQQSSGGGALIPLAVGLLALLAVGGIVVYYYRNGDDEI